MMWRLLYIRPSAQSRVSNAIAELAQHGRPGVESYYPREKVWSGIGVRRKPCDRPLLPSMIFVHAGDDDLADLMAIDGVYRRLDPQTSSQAISIAEFILSLRMAEAHGAYDKTVRKTVRLEIGTRVRVITGPYAGFHATVIGLNRSGRVKLVTSLFGREQRVTGSAAGLEPLECEEDTPNGQLAAA